jgi:predicted DNA-binding transcriptional regulator AlpA
MPSIHYIQKKYLSPKEVEMEYGLTEKTLERWRAQGKGPRYCKISARQIKYSREAVEGFMESSTVLTIDDHAVRKEHNRHPTMSPTL